MDNLEEIEKLEGEEEEEVIEETKNLLRRHITRDFFGKVVKGFDWKDVGEAFLGSLLFGFAMVVEDGTLVIGEFTASNPLFFVLSVFLVFLVTYVILYFIDIHDVRVINPILGVFPRRLIGVLLVSFLTATFMMTIWGRIDWSNLWVSINQVVIAWAVMALGASLGDILPGT